MMGCRQETATPSFRFELPGMAILCLRLKEGKPMAKMSWLTILILPL
jgi:hypothetical protein